MKKNDFLQELEELLETDDKLTEDTVLDELEEWDSLAMMSLSTFFDENFDIQANMDEVKKFSKVSDIISFLGSKLQ